jgi:microcystin-dependent protein
MACEGQLLQIREYQALYSLLGNAYGGDGQQTFALPKMMGRVLVGEGDELRLGNSGGEEMHVLTADEMPMHRHTLYASSAAATAVQPGGVLGSAWLYSSDPMMDVKMSTSETGRSEGHENMQPFITLRCIIAVQGYFPPRD